MPPKSQYFSKKAAEAAANATAKRSGLLPTQDRYRSWNRSNRSYEPINRSSLSANQLRRKTLVGGTGQTLAVSGYGGKVNTNVVKRYGNANTQVKHGITPQINSNSAAQHQGIFNKAFEKYVNKTNKYGSKIGIEGLGMEASEPAARMMAKRDMDLIDLKNVRKTRKDLKKALENETDEVRKAELKGKLKELDSIETGIKDQMDSVFDIGKQYFWGNEDKRFARVGTAVGLYAGGAIGLRTLSGGSLTQDAQGRPDIAGIPFV